MRLISSVFFVISILCAAQPSYAGFRIQPRITAVLATAPGVSVMSTRPDTAARMNSRALAFNKEHIAHKRRQQGEGGWAGLLAYICACTVVLTPLAVIFGAIGLSRRKNHRLAVKGFTYGVVYTALVILILVSTLAL